MTEFERTPEGKIKVPQFEADGRQRAERKQTMDKVKGILADEQRKALESSPMAPFKYKSVLAPGINTENFTEAELAELRQSEELAYEQHKGMAREKDASRRAWIGAGGTEESFQRRWKEGGEEAEIARRAEEIKRGSSATGVKSAY